MNEAQFRFHDDLNIFLPRNQRGTAIILSFNGDQSVKHLVESLGIPHVEVKRILVDGGDVDFSYLVRDGDQVEVYPYTHQDFFHLTLEDKRFILDNHLGQLAVYLRMLGFDALYRNDYQDEELARVSSQESRILLTRDRRLLMRNMVSQGYWLRSKIPRQQLVEVIERYNLSPEITPFRRCMRCNHLLEPISKQAVLHRLQPLTKRYYEEFRICPECDRVYWKGSHYERMRSFINQVLATGDQTPSS